MAFADEGLHPPAQFLEILSRVHPRCKGLIREISTVRHAMNRDGTYSENIVKLGDDVLDAARYLIVSLDKRIGLSAAERAQVARDIMAGGFV